MDTELKIADLIFKVVAGLFAAGWAIYLLRLIHRPLAQAGLLKSKMEVAEDQRKTKEHEQKIEEHRQKTEEYEQKKSLLSGLALDLQATAHRIPGRADFAIIAAVDITNRTESHVFRIIWKEDPLKEGPLEVWMANFDDAQGRPTYKKEVTLSVRRTETPNSDAMPLRIRPGATESLSFAVRVSAPGIYLVTFRVPLDPESLKDIKNFNMEMDMPGAWTRSAHVIVGDTPDTQMPTSTP